MYACQYIPASNDAMQALKQAAPCAGVNYIIYSYSYIRLSPAAVLTFVTMWKCIHS